jgi:hypothetical protein
MGRRVKLACQSSTCRRQIEMEISTGSETGRVSHPRCACGSEMKKTYSKPGFRMLSANLLTARKANSRFGGSHRAASNMSLGAFMKRVSTLFEVIVSAALLFLGLGMLYEASSNKSINEAAILIGGAVCFTLSMTILVSAVRSLLWHRRMLRKSMPNDELNSSSPEHNHGW